MSGLQEAINVALMKGYQIHPDALKLLENLRGNDYAEVVSRVILKKEAFEGSDFAVTKQDLISLLEEDGDVVGGGERAEKDSTLVSGVEDYDIINDGLGNNEPLEGMEGYRMLFHSRFKKLLRIASERPDSRQVRQIEDVRSKLTEGSAKIAGLLLERKGRRDSVQISLEDDTGSITAVVLNNSTKRKVFGSLLDQLVIADVERSKRGGYLVRDVYPPDIPDRVISFSGKNVYAVFLSDIHVGCKTFLLDAFNRFLSWLSGGDDDATLVSRIKYLVIAGDVVDGVGIYPGQELELDERDVGKQYERFAALIKVVPNNIKIFISPGNHDAVRQALPQPPIAREYVGSLYEMDNVVMLGDPAEIRLHGVNVLIYHGQSLPNVVSMTPGLSFDRPAEAMKVLLRARHLAPSYGGNASVAPEGEDRLVIERVPDIFHCGHIHTLDSAVYKGTLLLNTGTWQSQTRYQQNMGIVPVPGVAPIVNLSTLDVKTKSFL